MGLTLRNSFPNGSGTGSCDVDAPTGVTDDDLVFLLVVTSSDVVPTVPGEFYKISEITGTTRTTLFAKVADSEPASYHIYWDSGTGTAFACAVDSTTLTYPTIHQTATASSESASTNKVWTGVTNTDTNTLLLCFGGFGSNAGSTPDGAMTERIDTGNPRMYLMSQAVAASGATGTRTATGSSVATQRCITISVSESNTYPITYDPGITVTQLLPLAELSGEGAQVTEEIVLAEIAAIGIYTTQELVLAEFAAIGIYNTELMVEIEIEFVEPSPEDDVPTYFAKNAGTRSMHSRLPDEITGYAFDPDFSWWSTVVPDESTNLIINPSFENVIPDLPFLAVDEYEFIGFDDLSEIVEFPSVGATRGRRCAKIPMEAVDAGIAYKGANLSTGIFCTPGPYSFSCDIYATRPGMRFSLFIDDDVSTVFATRFFIAKTSGWHRYSVTYVELGSGARYPKIMSSNLGTNYGTLYTDGWQFEAKAYATTYLDGDMVSSSDVQPYQSYFWHGTPHASPSTRRAYANTGGRPVSWSEHVGFQTTNLIGLEMSPVELRLQQMADGREIHKGVNRLPRDFSITGKIYGENYNQVIRKHTALVALLKPNNALGSPQTILRYQRHDVAGDPVGAPMDIICSYREGLQGTINGLYQETLPLQFHASSPWWTDVIENSFELQLQKILYANGIIFRDETGDYVNLGEGGSDAFARRVGFLSDGSPVAAGPFDQLCGDTVSDIAKWNGENWVDLGDTWTGGTILDMDTGYKTGYPIVVSTADSVWELDPLAGWLQLGDSFDGNVTVVRRDIMGNIWAGGNFTTDLGMTPLTYNGIAKWNYETEAWEVLQEGLTRLAEPDDLPGVVTTILPTNDGNVYVGGDFYKAEMTSISTTQLATRVIRWDDNAGRWFGMGIGVDLEPKEFVQGKDGYIYAVGYFTTTTAGEYSVDMRGFMRFNGFQWEEMFPLVDTEGDVGADGVAIDEDGVFWFFKAVLSDEDKFDVSDTLGPVEFFGWKDGVFYPPFAQVTLGMWDLAVGPGNRIIYSVLRFAESIDPIVTNHDMRVPYLNEVDYGGNGDAPLVVHLEGPMNPVLVENLTTKGGLYFKYNLDLGDHETMVIRTDTQRSLVYSNGRSSLQRFVVPGLSNMLSIYLLPGLNRISVYCLDLGDGDPIGWLTWRNHFWGNDGAG